MKILRYLIIGLLVFSSCEKEAVVLYNLDIKPEEITRVELRADHKTLLPNGVAQVGFQTLVYATRITMNYPAKDADGLAPAKEITEEFLVPADQVPEGLLKIYDATGKELTEGYYSTTTDIPGTVHTFHAKAGNMESNRLTVTIRELPDESYPEIVIPVIFHILQPPAGVAPTYELSSEYLTEELQRASDTFNGKISTDPNLGNAKVTFKLAIYGPNGVRMEQPGVNIANISVTDYAAMGTSSTKRTQYLAYILAKKSTLIWDPNKYLNIWIARFSTSYASDYSGTNTSHAILPPQLIHTDYAGETIPGLALKEKDGISLADVTDCLQAGLMVNIRSLLMPTTSQGTNNDYRLATSLALHYGILHTYNSNYSSLIDGDNDYCPDTYSYNYRTGTKVYKNNELVGQPAGRPIEYFTSFNVMDGFGRRNSVSVDQASRLREVLEKCPDRWTYKSDWALTGIEN